MIAEKIICNTNVLDTTKLELDFIPVEWYETEKKILHKVSEKGVEVGFRNSGERRLNNGDVLWMENNKALAVKIQDCECIAVRPESMLEMGKVCYEMGNRHAPLFIENGELLTPFDEPLYAVLMKAGFKVTKKNGKLIESLGGHGHGHSH